MLPEIRETSTDLTMAPRQLACSGENRLWDQTIMLGECTTRRRRTFPKLYAPTINCRETPAGR